MHPVLQSIQQAIQQQQVPPMRAAFDAWLAQQQFPCILGGQWEDYATHWLDLRGQSGPFADLENVRDTDCFDSHLRAILTDNTATVGLGGYGEQRPFYNTAAYNAHSTRRRDVHLGLDVWAEANTPLYATLPGVVHSVHDNAGERDYGPTLILRHLIEEQVFFTLYGHLHEEVFDRWTVGDLVSIGNTLALIGGRPRNGNWPPHLHFQVILDMLDYIGDFPGVAYTDEQEEWMVLCPNPKKLIGLLK